MSRRNLTLLLSALLSVGLMLGATVTPVPYVAYEPGPTFNTLASVDGTPLIGISGRTTYPTQGHLDLVTVDVKSDLTLLEAVRDYVDRSRAVVPREFVYPPGQSDAQVQQQNEDEKLASEDDATLAALKQLDIPYTVGIVVKEVRTGAPADGQLQVDDVLTTIAGAAVTSTQQVRDAVAAAGVGGTVTVGYRRGGKDGTATLQPQGSTQGSGAVIGIVLGEKPEYGFTIDISLSNVGGPSAGMMFALGIIDKLTPDDLTGGRYIAGTGTIDPDGAVGAIGGIAQKMRGARGNGATVFLSPADNCAEARANVPSGLELVKVSTLSDALTALRTLHSGGTPPAC